MASKKKKPSLLDQWAMESREDTVRRTTLAAKGYLAHKSETLSSQFAHPEYMERAELLAEQIKQGKSGDGDLDD